MNQQKIGKFIQEKRKEKGLSQLELAEKLGVSNRTISKLGMVTVCQITLLLMIYVRN